MRLLRGAYRGYLVLFGLAVLLALVTDTAFAAPLLAMLIGAGILSIVVHELGHAVAAWAVGYRVVRIVSGLGPRLLGFGLGGTHIEFRLIPGGGHTLSSARNPTDNRAARWREFATVAGGPLASLALILMAARVLPSVTVSRPRDPDSTMTLVAIVESLGWWLLITNLVPWNPQVDGARLLSLLRVDDAGVAELADMRGTAEAVHHFERGDLDAAIAASADYGDNTAAAATHAAALSRAGRFGEARAVLVPLLDRPMPPERQCVVANNLAWVDVQLGDPQLLGEADQWSTTAIGLAGDPTPAALASTRAHVLAAQGRHDEAAPWFADALAGELDAEGRAEVLAGRARHRLGRGDAYGAREDADAAARLAPRSTVVQAARASVDHASLAVVADQLVPGASGWELTPALQAPSGRPALAGAARALVRLGPHAALDPVLFLAAADRDLALPDYLATLSGLVGIDAEAVVDPVDQLIA